MRTTLDIPEPLLEEARMLLGVESKTDAVVLSRQEVVRRAWPGLALSKSIAPEKGFRADAEKHFTRRPRRKALRVLRVKQF